MKTEYDTDTAFLYPITGKTGTPLYIPSCYASVSAGDKDLCLSPPKWHSIA